MSLLDKIKSLFGSNKKLSTDNIDQVIKFVAKAIPQCPVITDEEAQAKVKHYWPNSPHTKTSYEDVIHLLRLNFIEDIKMQGFEKFYVESTPDFDSTTINIMAIRGNIGNAYRIWKTKDKFYFKGSIQETIIEISSSNFEISDLPDLQHFLKLYDHEINKLINNNGMPDKMKEMFKTLQSLEWLNVLSSSVQSLITLVSKDKRSHSIHYKPPNSVSPYVSVSIWPNTNSQNLAERFQEEIGVPYYEALIQYANSYIKYGGIGFTHLFFYYDSREMGVALAFMPYSDDIYNWTTITPESINKQIEKIKENRF